MSEIMYYTEGGSVTLKQVFYPAGEPMVKTRDVPLRVLLRPRNMEAFMTCMFWFDALADRGHAMPELILPCVPGARQDRLMPYDGDQLFTIKSVAKELNARKLPSVTVLDPHSDVAPALIDRCKVIRSAEIFQECFRTYTRFQGVVAPDGGAGKRAYEVANLLRVPLLHGWKIRDTQTGKLKGFGCQPFQHMDRLLLVDDICDGGGTFVGLAEELHRMTDKSPGLLELTLFVPHGYFTDGFEQLGKWFTKILTTDSTPDGSIPSGGAVLRAGYCNYLLRKGF